MKAKAMLRRQRVIHPMSVAVIEDDGDIELLDGDNVIADMLRARESDDEPFDDPWTARAYAA